MGYETRDLIYFERVVPLLLFGPPGTRKPTFAIPDAVVALVDLDSLVRASHLFTPADIEFAARNPF